ncbi:hypothetical protein AAG906_019091 [Vitis piasezkii]
MRKIGLYGSFPIRELASLRDLEILDLRHNVLEGFQSSTQGYESLSTLGKLETLNLGYNSFNQTIIQQSKLSTLKNLVTLDLSWDKLNTLKIEVEQVEHLDLSSNNLIDTHILEFWLPRQPSNLYPGRQLHGTTTFRPRFGSFQNLEILNLRLNCLTGSVPSSIRALSSLKVLSLSNNRLNSSLSIQGVRSRLNSFEGILPPCLNNLTSRDYWISQNLLTELEVVEFTNDNNKFEIETEHSTWVPMFQLKINTDESISLSITCPKLPNWLLENNRDLKFLNLRHNSFMGQIHDINLKELDVSSNDFSEKYQSNLLVVVIIKVLKLSNNGFLLHLDNNEFSGLYRCNHRSPLSFWTSATTTCPVRCQIG